LETKDYWDQEAHLVYLVDQVFQEHLETQADLEMLALLEMLVRLEEVEKLVNVDQLELRDQRVYLEREVPMGSLANRDPRVQWEIQE